MFLNRVLMHKKHSISQSLGKKKKVSLSNCTHTGTHITHAKNKKIKKKPYTAKNVTNVQLLNQALITYFEHLQYIKHQF